MSIQVHVAGRGRVVDGTQTPDPEQGARCSLCERDVDVAVSVAADGQGTFACRDCLRARLEATTVAAYLLQDRGSGLPWGKISG